MQLTPHGSMVNEAGWPLFYRDWEVYLLVESGHIFGKFQQYSRMAHFYATPDLQVFLIGLVTLHNPLESAGLVEEYAQIYQRMGGARNLPDQVQLEDLFSERAHYAQCQSDICGVSWLSGEEVVFASSLLQTDASSDFADLHCLAALMTGILERYDGGRLVFCFAPTEEWYANGKPIAPVSTE